MRRYSDTQILWLGVVTLVIMLLIAASTFNLSKLPGLAGTEYQADFDDASGLRVGNMVQVGGIRSGRVEKLELQGNQVRVTFEVDNGVSFGTESEASVEVLNLLGEKYLRLEPKGEGQLQTTDVIPTDRTDEGYDIVGVLGDLTKTTEQIDTDQLKEALGVVADTLDTAAPEVRQSLQGIERISRTVSSRDQQLQTLVKRARSVSGVLADRSKDITKIMSQGDLVFQELRARKKAIHRLLVSAREMAAELRGLATDNQEIIGPALKELDEVLAILNRKDKQLRDTVSALGPYARILGNILGTGPWFDAYVVNLANLATGEFRPVELEN